MKDKKEIDVGFGIKIHKIKLRKTPGGKCFIDYKIKNALYKRKGGKK